MREGINLEAAREFCELILLGSNPEAVEACIETLKLDDEFAVSDMLHILSGYDEIGTVTDGVVELQHYLITSDVGFPDLDIFYGFIDDGLNVARNLNLKYDKDMFDPDECMIEWMDELSVQIESQGLFIYAFDGGSDNYHYMIDTFDRGEKAIEEFNKITANVTNGYRFCGYTIDI